MSEHCESVLTMRHSLYLKKRSSHCGVASPLRNFSEYQLLKHPSYSCLIFVHFSPMLDDMIAFRVIDVEGVCE